MIRAPGLVLVVLAAFAATGCGSVGRTEAGDAANGKRLFQENCARCHALADAASRAAVGPDLDAAFRRARKDGIGESTIRDVVRGQIAYPVQEPPTGAPGMPANLVTGQDADDVAVYVAMVAGTKPEGAQVAAGGGGGKADGKSIFASAGCGGCHTLADAGTNGTIGPNLDEAKPSVQLAVDRVTNGKGQMPSFADQLSGAQIQAVAEYVARAAGK
jgi:cbb3-type cytochrome c oxidase subunit III